MEVPSLLELTDSRNNDPLVARIEILNRDMAMEISSQMANDTWWRAIDGLISDPHDQPDFDWDWVALVSKMQNRPNCRAVCVRTDDSQIQGAMLYRIGEQSRIEPNEKAIFVDRLATAPANRGELVETPAFRGVGEGLLRYAIAESWLYGLHGRVNLFAVANHHFYRNRGFELITTTGSEGSGPLYEIAAGDAEAYLRRYGVL